MITKSKKTPQIAARTTAEYKKKVEEFARKNYLTVTALVHKALDQVMRETR